jgi:hypothetical protein
LIAASIGLWGTIAVYAVMSSQLEMRITLVALAAPTIVALVIAPLLQGRAYREHVRRGGKTASILTAAGIGAVCGIALLGAYLGRSYLELAWSSLGPEKDEPALTFGPHEKLYYAEGATEADARSLGQYLQKLTFFNGTRRATVRLTRKDGTWVVAIVLKDNSWNDPETVESFRVVKQLVAREAFPGQPVKLQLCDRNLNPQNTVD